jgi:hypothetical protein
MVSYATVVIVPAFGVPSTTRSNQWLRRAALEESAAYDNAAIWTQKDTGFLPEADPRVYFTPEIDGFPPPTWHVMRDAMKWIRSWVFSPQPPQRIVLVAAPPHQKRALRDLRMALKEADWYRSVEIAVSAKLPVVPYDAWFEGSTQWYTATRQVWENREKKLDCIIEKMPFGWQLYKLISWALAKKHRQ